MMLQSNEGCLKEIGWEKALTGSFYIIWDLLVTIKEGNIKPLRGYTNTAENQSKYVQIKGFRADQQWVLVLPYWAESGSDTSLSVSSSSSTFCCLSAKVSSSSSVGLTRPTWVQSSGILKGTVNMMKPFCRYRIYSCWQIRSVLCV